MPSKGRGRAWSCSMPNCDQCLPEQTRPPRRLGENRSGKATLQSLRRLHRHRQRRVRNSAVYSRPARSIGFVRIGCRSGANIGRLYRAKTRRSATGCTVSGQLPMGGGTKLGQPMVNTANNFSGNSSAVRSIVTMQPLGNNWTIVLERLFTHTSALCRYSCATIAD